MATVPTWQDGLRLATSSRLLVCITAKFNVGRLEDLTRVLREFSEYLVESLEVVLVSDVAHGAEYDTLLRTAQMFLPPDSVSISSHTDLASPLDLPWCHHDILRKRFLRPDSRFTHFILVEDDLRLSFRNFVYFLTYRDALKELGLVPSFLRVEYNRQHNYFYCADVLWSTRVQDRPRVTVGDVLFVEPRFPYIGMYIVDVDLAREYVETRSFDMETSKSVSDWPHMERSMLSVCFENPPDGFASRYVIPTDPLTLKPMPMGWVHHLADKYTNLDGQELGLYPVSACFHRGEDHPVSAGILGNPHSTGLPLQETVMRAIYGDDIWRHFTPSAARSAEVEGWNGRHPALARAAASVPNGIFVDVGVWKGQSSIFLAECLRDGGRDGCVISVDTFLGSTEFWIESPYMLARRAGRPGIYEIFLDNVHYAGLSDYVVPLPKTSIAASKLLGFLGLRAGLIHIDASHEHDDVMADIEAYWPLLAAGGTMIGDDYDPAWPGVVSAANLFSARIGLPLAVDDRKWIIIKTE